MVTFKIANHSVTDSCPCLEPTCKGLSLIEGIASNIDDRLSTVLKLHILLYADDTVLLAETPSDLQKCIRFMEDYCNTWGLKINSSKTFFFLEVK